MKTSLSLLFLTAAVIWIMPASSHGTYQHEIDLVVDHPDRVSPLPYQIDDRSRRVLEYICSRIQHSRSNAKMMPLRVRTENSKILLDFHFSIDREDPHFHKLYMNAVDVTHIAKSRRTFLKKQKKTQFDIEYKPGNFFEEGFNYYEVELKVGDQFYSVFYPYWIMPKTDQVKASQLPKDIENWAKALSRPYRDTSKLSARFTVDGDMELPDHSTAPTHLSGDMVYLVKEEKQMVNFEVSPDKRPPDDVYNQFDHVVLDGVPQPWLINFELLFPDYNWEISTSNANGISLTGRERTFSAGARPYIYILEIEPKSKLLRNVTFFLSKKYMMGYCDMYYTKPLNENSQIVSQKITQISRNSKHEFREITYYDVAVNGKDDKESTLDWMIRKLRGKSSL